MIIKHIYRLSDNGYAKEKFEFATKEVCLTNFIHSIWAPQNLTVMVDDTNLKDETLDMAMRLKDEHGFSVMIYTGGSSAASWRHAVNFAMDMGLDDEDAVYFVEDDYLHLPGTNPTPNDKFVDTFIEEGLGIADYVSLYDHMDKYIPASKGGNKFIGEDACETTKVALTKSTHWKLTNSTTMTFATRLGTLKDDKEVWEKYTMGSHPNDFAAFIELRHKGKSLITPLPGRATHCEPTWAAPLVEWEHVR